MAILQSTTISGSINDTGSLQITGSTFMPPQIESALTSSFTASGLLWINADNGNLQYTTETSKGTIQSPASFMGAWSAGGTLITARHAVAGAGTQNASIAMGGRSPGAASNTEEYDGSNWSTGGSLIVARGYGGGAGTQNEALLIGGYANANLSCTEEYNGTSWSTGGALITQRGGNVGAAGSQNSALGWGGYSPSILSSAETYNGTSWSSGDTLARAISYVGAAGTQNSALSAGGTTPGSPTNQYVSCVEGYDGTSWSACNSLSEIKSNIAGTGTITAAIIFGGRNCTPSPATTTATEEWNGINWVNGCNMITGRFQLGSAGSQDAGLAFGGNSPSLSNLTEEYTKNDIVPYTARVWSSAGGAINARCNHGSGGDQAAFAIFGGVTNVTPYSNVTELYDGSIWTTGPNMIQGRRDITSAGTQNSAIGFFGYTGIALSCTEEYNGSSWSAGGSTIIARQAVAGMGLQDAAVGAGGYPNASVGTCVEEYNGTSWATGGALTICRESAMQGSGTQNAGLVTGGGNAGGNLTSTEEYNGSSWSSGGDISGIQLVGGQAGTQNASTIFGGQTNPTFTISSSDYDGTSWAVTGNMLVARTGLKGGGTQNSAIAVGGRNNDLDKVSCVEEFNAVCSTTMCSALGTWSAAADMINARNTVTTTGTQNATLSAGGSSPLGSCSEEYNGLSWTAGGALINSYFGRAAAGTQDASLAAGAYTPPSFQSATEEYNGSTWSAGGNLSTARWNSTSGGTQNAAYIAGGWQGSMSTATEEYNGSSWSAGGTFPAKYGMFGGSVGTQNSGFAIGGYKYPAPAPNVQQSVQSYDGTSWSSENDILARRDVMPRAGTNAYEVWIGDANSSPQSGGTQLYDGVSWSWGKPTNRPQMKTGAGSQTSALAVTSNGLSPHGFSCGWTEEFTCVTSGACVASGWSIGPDLITGRADFDGAGTRTAGIMVGGRTPTTTGVSEEYNGTSYSSGGSLINARSHVNALGTQNATLASAGSPTPAGSNLSEEYDGTSWSAGGTMITARFNVGSTGVQNAGLATGGQNNAIVTCTEEYDGTSWTSGGALGIALGAIDAVGTQNDAITQGQSTPGTSTQIYDGTSWSAGPNFNVSRNNPRGIGTTTNDVMMAGGRYANSSGNNVEEYNGVAWTNHSALNHNRYAMGAIGSGASSGNVAGGYGTPPGGLNAKSFTEEYQVATQGAGLTYKRNEVTGS